VSYNVVTEEKNISVISNLEYHLIPTPEAKSWLSQNLNFIAKGKGLD
jgi:hypothetical protein